MEILGVGPAELILIALIAFIVLGPERLPALMHTLGKWIHRLQQAFYEIEVHAELNDAVEELQATRQDLQELNTKLAHQLPRELGLTHMLSSAVDRAAPSLNTNYCPNQRTPQFEDMANKKDERQ